MLFQTTPKNPISLSEITYCRFLAPKRRGSKAFMVQTGFENTESIWYNIQYRENFWKLHQNISNHILDGKHPELLNAAVEGGGGRMAHTR